MKIGIDISSIVYGTGVSRYTANLCEALISEYPKEEFTLYGGAFRQSQDLKKFGEKFDASVTKKYALLPPKIQSFMFNQLHVPIEALTSRLDVFHSWDWYTPQTKRAALVTTIHDLSAIRYPQDTHPEIVAHHKKSLAWIKKEAQMIIAVSQSTKKDIIDLLGIDPDRIEVVYEALPSEQEITPTKESLQKVKSKFKINRPYIVLVASQEPRKNINRAIKAFTPLAKTHDLVLVGKAGFDVINSEAFVIKTGYVTGEELAALYRGSKGLLYPSYYEGFGLPILEAFFHKIPVITSNLSSLPEVAGKAASFCNPMQTESITQAIISALKQSKTLTLKGTEQLKKFNWKKAAKQTMDVYKMAYLKR